jgi:hypothetical protein
MLQITHASGDDIEASNLYIRGSGLDQTGSWASLDDESMNSTTSPPMITSGERLVVGADTDFAVRIVWEARGESLLFAEEFGPDTQ